MTINLASRTTLIFNSKIIFKITALVNHITEKQETLIFE